MTRAQQAAWARAWLLCCALVLALLLGGCSSQQLYTDLRERDANEMIAALQTANIEGTKVSQGKQLWTVEVPQGDFARAVAVLRSAGLPRPQFDTLGSVFKKGGLGDNATDAHARYVHARQQELTAALHKIDGVLDASVELSIPEKDRLLETPVQPSASVLVKYRPGSNIQARAGDIKSLVASGIEGLAYDRVNVVMFRAEEASLAPPAGSPVNWMAVVALAVAALLGIAGALGYLRRGGRGRMLVERGR